MRKGLLQGLLKAVTAVMVIVLLFALAAFIRTAFFHRERESGSVLSSEEQAGQSGPSGLTLDEYLKLVEAPLFTVPKEEPKPVVEETPEEPEPAPAPTPPKPTPPAPRWSQPDLSLKGTIIGGAYGNLAIIAQGKTSKEGLYAVDDEVEGATIIKIERNKATLTYRGREFELVAVGGGKSVPLQVAGSKTEPTGGRRPSTPTQAPVQEVIKVDRLEVMKQASNMAEILTQVKIKPYYRYRQIRGFRVENIPADSFLRTVGLKDGDVVTKVNGEVIDSFSKAIQIGRRMQNKNYVKVIVIRNGQEITLVYNLK